MATTDPIFDALVAASSREPLATAMGTAELRELAAGIRARAVFTARGTSAIYASKIKEVVDLMAAGEMDHASARVTLLETLRALGYTPEGGFPGDQRTEDGGRMTEVPPAVAGSLQDLSSTRRLDLILSTQRDLMRGAGLQHRGTRPHRLALFPAWELVRIYEVEVPRDWASRWEIAGGGRAAGRMPVPPSFTGGTPVLPSSRMIALKGDPVWGELGLSGNFEDALDVDTPPFAFNSGMGWREVDAGTVRRLGVTGPGGESYEDFHGKIEHRVIAGKLPPPAEMSVREVPPEIREELEKDGEMVIVGDTATTPENREALRAKLEERRLAREARRAERLERAVRRAADAYEGRAA